MLVLIEDKTVSGTGSFVASISHFTIYYISRLGFISILAFMLPSGTQRIFSARRLLHFFCSFVVYMFVIEKKQFKKINQEPDF